MESHLKLGNYTLFYFLKFVEGTKFSDKMYLLNINHYAGNNKYDYFLEDPVKCLLREKHVIIFISLTL